MIHEISQEEINTIYNWILIDNYLLQQCISNSSPQAEGRCNNRSLERIKWKDCVVRGFIRMSANWSLDEMEWTSSWLEETCSLTKWKSTSTWRVHARNAAFEEMKTTPRLSHQIFSGWEAGRRSSWINLLSHWSSTEVFATALNSDYVDEWATVDCFLELHPIKLHPR